MKIYFATDYLPGFHDNWGGAETACLRLAELLSDAGQEVSFLTTPPVRFPESKFKVFPVETMNSRLKSHFCWDSHAAKIASGILRAGRPDILHLHRFNSLSLSLIKAARELNIPTVFSVYDYWCLCPRTTGLDSSGRVCRDFQGRHCLFCNQGAAGKRVFIRKNILALRRRVFNYFLNKLDAVIVLSDSCRKDLLDFGIKGNIVKLPLPLEAGGIPRGHCDEESVFFAGWLYAHKGLHILIEAMAKVKEEIPKIRLYVAETGVDGVYKNTIAGLINKYGLGDTVIFLGKKTHSQTQALLEKAGVVCVPEQWPNPYPIVITEAMLKARPVVASSIGGIPELITDGENGLLADPGNPRDFADKIIRLLKDKEFAVGLAGSARQDILKRCNRREILNKLLSIYAKVS